MRLLLTAPGRSVSGNRASSRRRSGQSWAGQRPRLVHVLYFDAAVQKVEAYQAGQRSRSRRLAEAERIFGRALDGIEERGTLP